MDEQQSAPPHARGCFFCDVAAPQIEAFIDNLWSQNTRDHFRNASLEVLKGMRSILDSRINDISKHAQKGAKVNVE